jgi:uncharacterized protein
VIDPELLAILVCPDTHQPLSEASADLVERINGGIGRGEVKNQGGEVVSEPIEGALLREDEKLLYPIRQSIPVLLIEEGIPADVS